jgi:uncharacterized membrane protein
MEKKAMKWSRSMVLLFSVILSIAGTLSVYDSLPEQIPFHWNLSGEIDSYADRIYLLFTAMLPLFLYGLFIIIPKIDPKPESFRIHAAEYSTVIAVLILFLISLHWAVIAVSFGVNIDIVFWIRIALGLIFIVMGNYMGGIRHNYTFGIRTPWTLADEDVWNKTHRLGGYIFAACGALIFAFAFAPSFIAFMITIGSILLSVSLLFVYSYLIFAKKKPK